MTPVPVTDPDDPRLEPYRQVRERDLVGRQGRFVAEGEVVIRTLLGPASRHAAESVLVAEKRLAKLADALAGLDESVPVYVAGQAVMDAVTGFPIHRGMLAIGRRGPEASAGSLLQGVGPEAIVLVLAGIGNHDNIGGLFRAAAAFGAAAVLLDPGCCDPLYRKAIRVSVGAALRVPFARLAAGEDPLALLQAHGFEALAFTPAGRETLAELRGGGRRAVLLGGEGPGLPPELLARCRTVAIPMADGFDSLNVATTGAIALHHLRFGG